MRAFTVTGKEQAGLSERPVPMPQEGQALLRIEACGLNFADLLMVKGTYQDTPETPFVPGMEVCGVVEDLGPNTKGPAPGTRVAVFGGSGGLAQKGVFPAAHCVPVPDDMPAEIAAGFIVAYSTSHVALSHRARLLKGERLAVLGAAGGVGLTAVELGAQMGAEVIAIARGDDKLAVAKEAGAHHLVDAKGDIRADLKALGGVDVLYDAVGGDPLRAALRALRPEGRALLIGFASGDVPQLAANHLLVKNIDAIGFYWGGYLTFRPKIVLDSIAALFDMYGRGDLRPHVSHVLPLEEVAEAMDLIRSRRSTGKVVVSI
ncbi:MAG: NADPH:quinone oxidoreductase family protein [Pseudomonadota bacterium]